MVQQKQYVIGKFYFHTILIRNPVIWQIIMILRF